MPQVLHQVGQVGYIDRTGGAIKTINIANGWAGKVGKTLEKIIDQHSQINDINWSGRADFKINIPSVANTTFIDLITIWAAPIRLDRIRYGIP